MIEKIITLDDVTLIDFLGIENRVIRELAAAYPKSRIISRGNQIKVIGNENEVKIIEDVIGSLIDHYHRFGKVSQEIVEKLIRKEEEMIELSIEDGEVIVYGNKGHIIKPKSPNQKKIVVSSKKNDLVFAVGPAGTGKTYIAVAIAVRALKNKEVKKIVITRPAVEAGENLGFLPGDLKEKIDPYLRPIYDALDDMVAPEKLKYYYENRIIEIAPLAYMRGRTLHNAFILLDEAQNTTPMQIKMFMTRMGPNSKMIITGDRSQIDLPGSQKSGLIEAVNTLRKVEGVGIVELNSKDVMRHKLVERIINAYERRDKKNAENKTETAASATKEKNNGEKKRKKTG